MKYEYEEANHAKDLHHALIQELATSAPQTDITIEGAGVHWNCSARRGERLCSIACFHTQGPEYLVFFEHEAERMAAGRTESKKDVLAAVKAWLQGHELQKLYDRFRFVDKDKRTLIMIETEMRKCCPELKQGTSRELRHIVCDLYEMWFRAQDRSCRISYYGKNTLPDAVFFWDECHLFQLQTGEFKQLALVLKRWLCDYVMPSDLEKEFPCIDVGKLARYYEEGRGVEGEFIMSWDGIEQFYDDMRAANTARIKEFIAQMRERGYDKTLRAGQSLWTLIVSRSRRHGLRQDQPHIAFCFRNNGMDVYLDMDRKEKLSLPHIQFTTRIDALLKQLEAKDID
ncbi:MAG: hypothetical protein M3347_06860 [Armatimonadota bacterium]|nr:hypothetical protein [Armatimonadota bacterium]